MNRIKLILLLSVLCGDNAYLAICQSISLQEVKNELDIMFSALDKTKVPTGYLWDTAVNLVDGESYNGNALTDSNYVSISLLADMISSINSASVGADTLCVESSIRRLQRQSSPWNQKVGLFFQPYNYIVSNALSDNLISYENGVVSDNYIDEVWQNPYGEESLFGFAVGQEDNVDFEAVFSFTNVDSLSTQMFQSIQFDPGDGYGYRSVSMGGTVSAHYSSEGYVESKLSVTVGGRVYKSHSLLFVKAPQVESDALPDSFEVEAGYQGKTYKARVSYNTPLCFDNPFIVAEGFDPWNFSTNKYHSYSGSTNIKTFENTVNNLVSDRNLFYVDWYDCGADIRANAEVLKAVIDTINVCKTSGHPNIVMGQSMGGLIARYALRDMELHGQDHETSIFISHDVPYCGANVSPGFLYAYWDLFDATDNILGLVYSLFGSHGNDLVYLRKMGEFQSVKQMLPNYLDATWNYNNAAFLSLQEELFQMGFPVGSRNYPTENIAIVNGGKSPQGTMSWYLSTDKLFDLNCNVSTSVLSELLLSVLSFLAISNKLPLLWVPGKTTLKFYYKVFPYLSNNCVVSSSKLLFIKKYLWLVNAEFVLNDKIHHAPSAGVPLDAVGGSFYDTNSIMSLDHPDTTITSVWGSYSHSIAKKDSLMFIPTASAMSMPDDYNRDFYNNLPSAGTDTPFTSYILQSSATEHIGFFSGIEDWLDIVTGTYIVGPEIVFDGDVFQISGPHAAGTPFTWSTSDSSIATINQSTGELHVFNPGLLTVIATNQTAGRIITKRKTVIVRMPKMTINYTNVGDSYTMTGAFVSQEVLSHLEYTGLRDSIIFSWSVKIDSDSLETVQTPLSTYSFQTCAADTVVTVYMSITLLGVQGETYSITVKRPSVFLCNIQSINKRYETGKIAYITDLFGFPFDSNKPPKLMIKKNTVADSEGIIFSHIRYNGINYYSHIYEWYPPGSSSPEQYYSFDILSDTFIQRMLYFMTPDFSPTYIVVDVYDVGFEFVQRINIPVYCSDAILPL